MKRPALILAPLILLAFGCASGSDVEKLSSQITDLQDQITELKRQVSSKEEVQQINTKVAQQTQTLLQSNADVQAKVTDIDDKLQNAQGMIEQTNYRLDRLVQQLTQQQRDINDLKGVRGSAPQPGGEPVEDEVTVQPGSSSAGDPLETYQTAYRDYQKGNYDLAIQGFQDFLEENSNSELADNAAYWIGESLYSQKKYKDAIQQFDAVINTFSTSDKVPASLLKKGYSYVELGQKAQGIVQLQYVIHEHPRAQEASLARQKLKTLGIETN
jgi:tol-pal system protein YbgF